MEDEICFICSGDAADWLPGLEIYRALNAIGAAWGA